MQALNNEINNATDCAIHCDSVNSSLTSPQTLADAPLREYFLVKEVVVSAELEDGTERNWARWLDEIGFVPGERVMLMQRAPFGDPLVVRVGVSTFALRVAEAACIHIQPLTE
jgi:ferrous iron transport protein A